ncbi:gamma-butyrobetaine dioxygenase [Streptacidiphilus sp. PB12-B1b]|uniref:2-trimethylaminoethylphosphonate dioxygenase n=1 Tax=Streptacidiphilus sp. PB12-B1b TaxID=2705012 RepID=UPI0015FE70CC|nr:phosphonate degradation HD-domain oxygenase [Streptacidiphilus sp. PB12-B1b]QMU77650.1 gamma-butyrobetaine dioxygenase [Streptacidiphilus sp. PB12-B1b]
MPNPASLPPLWLRDNCGCADCRDPRNGQKLFQITDLPEGLAVAAENPAAVDGAPGWEVRWTPDGHVSRYAESWLAADVQQSTGTGQGTGRGGDQRTEDAKTLWRAADLTAPGSLPTAAWADYRADPAVRLRTLDAVGRLGFALLTGVPADDGQVTRVAETFGYVRETNYGRIFEVRIEENPSNLAFTGERITPHTDNPYRDPVPTLQLLHCLVNSAEGGDSGLVDGFAAAALLREEDPAAFETLTRIPVPFRFADTSGGGAEVTAHRPLIGTDPRGRIREIRFNNRSIGTLRLPADDTRAFYTAYRAFARLLLRPELQLDFRLAPGDCLIFDNTRLLHARTAFASSGGRHLQGCYADLDGLFSTAAVLRRGVLDQLADLFAEQGSAEYFGEDVTQAQHMLQAGALAQAEGAPPALVAAAVLHDLGHFHGEVTGHDLMEGTDNRHSHTGADWLAQWFGPAVTEPVRLHVAAKRYLCAVEPGYFALLSPASVHTLAVQGGPMTPAEAEQFAAHPYGADAVRLRRWDEAAKDPQALTPGFAHFRPLLAELLAPGGTASLGVGAVA